MGPPLKEIASISENVIVKEWGGKLIKGWNESNWMEQPLIVGNKIANLIGGDQGSIVAGDTLSIKTYQALAAAIKIGKSKELINKRLIVILPSFGERYLSTAMFESNTSIQARKDGYL